MKPLFVAIVMLAIAKPGLSHPASAILQNATPCEFEALFRQSDLGCTPCGQTRGAVLYADSRHPRVKARLQGIAWKGKHFHGDGSLTNRWLGGVHAISTDTRVEPSWIDGQPCLVMQYPSNAPIFANVRDELRQIAPDVWLGRSFDAATGRSKNWFILRK